MKTEFNSSPYRDWCFVLTLYVTGIPMASAAVERCDESMRCAGAELKKNDVTFVAAHETWKINRERLDLGSQIDTGIQNDGALQIGTSEIRAYRIRNGQSLKRLTGSTMPNSTITDSKLELKGNLEITSGAVRMERSEIKGNVDVMSYYDNDRILGGGVFRLNSNSTLYGAIHVEHGAAAILSTSDIEQAAPSSPAATVKGAGGVTLNYRSRIESAGVGVALIAGNTYDAQLTVDDSELIAKRGAAVAVVSGDVDEGVRIVLRRGATVTSFDKILLEVEDAVRSTVDLNVENSDLYGDLDGGMGATTHASFDDGNLDGAIKDVATLTLRNSTWRVARDSRVGAITGSNGTIDVSRGRLNIGSLSGDGAIRWHLSQVENTPSIHVEGDMSGVWGFPMNDPHGEFKPDTLKDTYTLVAVKGENRASVMGESDIGAYRYSTYVDSHGNVIASRAGQPLGGRGSIAHGDQGAHLGESTVRSDHEDIVDVLRADGFPVGDAGNAGNAGNAGGAGEVGSIRTDEAPDGSSHKAQDLVDADVVRGDADRSSTSTTDTGTARPVLNAGATAAVEAMSMANARAIWDTQWSTLRIRQQALREFLPASGTVWAQTFNGSSTLNNGYSRDANGDFDLRVTGAAVGTDRVLKQTGDAQWIGGAYAVFVDASRTNGQSRGGTRGYGLGLYSTFTHVSGWYLDSMLAYGIFDQSFSAQYLSAGEHSRVKVTDWRGHSAAAGFEFGRAIALPGNWTLQPALGLRHVHLGAESAKSDVGHTLAGDSKGTTGVHASVTLSRAFRHAQTVFHPYVRVGYGRDFHGTQRVRYAGATIETDTGASRRFVNAGVSAEVANSHGVLVDGQYQASAYAPSSYQIQLGYRYTF